MCHSEGMLAKKTEAETQAREASALIRWHKHPPPFFFPRADACLSWKRTPWSHKHSNLQSRPQEIEFFAYRGAF